MSEVEKCMLAMEAKIKQLQAENKRLEISRDAHSKIRQRHLVKLGKCSTEIVQFQAEIATYGKNQVFHRCKNGGVVRPYKKFWCSLCCNDNEDTDFKAIDEIDRLQAEDTDLKNTLQSLVDIQNGSPLVRDEKEWQKIMDKACGLLLKP